VAKRIMIVDDEPSVVKSCARMLELHGYEVVGTGDGSTAIARYREEPFDLVLLDLRMPGMDGLQVLRELREYDRNACVAILTAYGTKENVVEAFRLGAREFMEKPVDSDTLVSRVKHIIGQGQGDVHGNLRTLSLSTIIQINCEERNEACLRLRRRGEEGVVFFSDGDVVHAEVGSEAGEEAVYELLSWQEGDFEIEMGAQSPRRTIHNGWSGLLLEGMRRIDEHAADQRHHCSTCGCFLDDLGRCHNPSCSEFADGVEVWDDEQFVESIELEQTEVNEMAELNDLLKSMADDIPGFVSSDVVGMDGLSIAGHAADPDFDAEAASAQFALVMKLVQKTVGQLGDDAVEDNLVTSQNAYILTRFLGDGSYYLGVAVDKEAASLGNLRLMTRRYADDLWDAIPK